jgi:hypothetical protein
MEELRLRAGKASPGELREGEGAEGEIDGPLRRSLEDGELGAEREHERPQGYTYEGTDEIHGLILDRALTGHAAF